MTDERHIHVYGHVAEVHECACCGHVKLVARVGARPDYSMLHRVREKIAIDFASFRPFIRSTAIAARTVLGI